MRLQKNLDEKQIEIGKFKEIVILAYSFIPANRPSYTFSESAGIPAIDMIAILGIKDSDLKTLNRYRLHLPYPNRTTLKK